VVVVAWIHYSAFILDGYNPCQDFYAAPCVAHKLLHANKFNASILGATVVGGVVR
jgi:hypothetical protein